MYLFIEFVLYNILVMPIEIPPSNLISSGLTPQDEAKIIITGYVNNIFTTTGITKDIFDIANNDTINKYINTITNITNSINKDSKTIYSKIKNLNDITTMIQTEINTYNSNLAKLDSYFDDSSASIGRYNDSLEVYNLKLLENILYSIGILILIYKMIGWNININL